MLKSLSESITPSHTEETHLYGQISNTQVKRKSENKKKISDQSFEDPGQSTNQIKKTPKNQLLHVPLIEDFNKSTGSSGLGQILEGEDEQNETSSISESAFELSDVSEKPTSRQGKYVKFDNQTKYETDRVIKNQTRQPVITISDDGDGEISPKQSHSKDGAEKTLDCRVKQQLEEEATQKLKNIAAQRRRKSRHYMLHVSMETLDDFETTQIVNRISKLSDYNSSEQPLVNPLMNEDKTKSPTQVPKKKEKSNSPSQVSSNNQTGPGSFKRLQNVFKTEKQQFLTKLQTAYKAEEDEQQLKQNVYSVEAPNMSIVTKGMMHQSFEHRMASAMADEHTLAVMDSKSVIKNRTDTGIYRPEKPLFRSPNISPMVRKAITLVHKSLMRAKSMKEETEGINTFEDQGSDEKPIDPELALLIEQTYNYIYSVEEKRITRRVNKIQDLYDSNPLQFDDSKVSIQLERLRKMKQNSDLMKSHIQMYEQQMANAQAARKFMAYLIKKHKINVTKHERDSAEGNQHIANCGTNYQAYFTYKQNEFFKKKTYAEQKPKQAADLIKHIVHKVTMKEQLLILGRLINQYLPPKNQRVLMQKCQNILSVDQKDENIYLMVDESKYTLKPFASSPTNSGEDASPRSPIRSPGLYRKKSSKFDSPRKQKEDCITRLPSIISQESSSTSLIGLDSNRSLKITTQQSKTSQKKQEESKKRMVQAFNMEYILSQVEDDKVKDQFEKCLVAYIKDLIRTMPRIVNDDHGLTERFAILKKLLVLVQDLPNKFSWERRKTRNSLSPPVKEKNIDQLNTRDNKTELQKSDQMIVSPQSLHLSRLNLDDIKNSADGSKLKRQRVTFHDSFKRTARVSPTLQQEDSVFSSADLRGNSAEKSQGEAKNLVIKQIVAKLAKEKLKSIVPLQVYRDCADVINQAFKGTDSTQVLEQRKKKMAARMRSPCNENLDLNQESNRQKIRQAMLVNLSQESTQHSITRNQNTTASASQLSSSTIQALQNGTLNTSGRNHKRGGSMRNPTRRNEEYGHTSFLPKLSRNQRRDVQCRSTQMLRNLKDLNEARVFESTHAKFKPRVADLTKDWQRNEKKDTFLKSYSSTQRRGSQNSFMSSACSSSMSKNPWTRSEVVDKLRKLIQLCLDDATLKSQIEESNRKMRRNKVTFKSVDKKSPKRTGEEFGDQTGLAFRKDVFANINKTKVLFKQIEMYNYSEDLRNQADKELNDFFEQIDPHTAPRNVKLLYFYFVGSRNLILEMTNDTVATYRHDQMQPPRRELTAAIIGKGKRSNLKGIQK